MARARRAPLAFWLTAAAFAWSLALPAAAFLLPVYRGTIETTSGGVSSTSATLVGLNGLAVLVPVCVPALLAAVIWLALHRTCSRRSRAASVTASAAIALLAAFNVLALFTIGVFVLPVTLLLVWAASLTRAGQTACVAH